MMGLTLRKSFRIFPGVRLNVNARSAGAARTAAADPTTDHARHPAVPSADGGGVMALHLSEIQAAAWANKVGHGFNTTSVPMEFGLLTAEVGEAFTAWRKGLPDLGEELADVLLYLVAVAEMTGVDLATEVDNKMRINVNRRYRPNEAGAYVLEES